MSENLHYNAYASHLKEKYGEKVYKLPIHLRSGCPNRDGLIGTGGCDFCAENGTGFELLSEQIPVEKQIARNMNYIGGKYGASKFIAYFQNYSNTYMSFDEFKTAMLSAIHPQIVEYSVSTRPDCVGDKHLEYLAQLRRDFNVQINIELGLQTANYRTLYKINRGHGLASFIDAVMRIHQFEFEICAHVIVNLPGDDKLDVIETAEVLSALRVEQVKLHALYIMKNTKMGSDYEKGLFEIISLEEYVERVILFLEHLRPDIVVQRIVGRAPEADSLFVNWGMSWWKIRDLIHNKMEQQQRYQGSKWALALDF